MVFEKGAGVEAMKHFKKENTIEELELQKESSIEEYE